MSPAVSLLDLIDTPGEMWDAAHAVRVRLEAYSDRIRALEADLQTTKQAADALAAERDDLRERLAAVTIELATTRKQAPRLASPLVAHPGVVVDIAATLELDPGVVCDLVRGRPVAGIHPTIAERARLMWTDATEPFNQETAA